MGERRYTRCEVAGSVATAWLDHPPLNLICEEMKEELFGILDQLEADPGVRVVILTGAGTKAFCAGRDLKQTRSWQEAEDPQLEAVWARGDRLIDRILFYPKLTVAALNGVTLGGGCELTLPFDLVLAERGIRIGLPEVSRGLWPGTGAMKLLPKKIGFFRARELVFLGKILSAEEALAWGLVNAVTDQPALEAAREFARGLSRLSFSAMMRAKEVMNRHERWSDAAALHFERTEFASLFASPDAREGVRAFFEKRDPRFT
jgi:enoyl-CoA hydratase/carnithine racemase